MNTIDSLAFMFSLKIGRQCTPPPPQGMEKLKSKVKVTFWFWLMYPPPRMEKLKSQVKVTFWFWLMYPPPPEIEIGLNMNAIEQKLFQERSSSTFYNLPGPSASRTII